MKIINIDGGIGRVLCATPALKALSDQEEITVITPWPAVFEHAPFKVYSGNSSNLFEDVISRGVYVSPEPYHMYEYYTQTASLADAFALALGVGIASRDPLLVLSDAEKLRARELKSHILNETGKQKIVAFQPFGAGAKATSWGVIDETHRSFSGEDASRLATMMYDMYPEVVLFNASHIKADHKNIWQESFSDREYLVTLAVADAVFTVDSCLAHVGRAYGLRGVQVLGPTFRQNIGYDAYATFQRDGYPKSYQANRMYQAVDKNHDAMKWTEDELASMVKAMGAFLV